MRVRDLQILTGLMVGISAILFVAAWGSWAQSDPDIGAREIAKWQPTESFNSVGFIGPGTQSSLSEALARPLFRHSRKPFDPAQAIVAETVAEPAPQPAFPPPDASQLSVRGILINGESMQALIVTPDAPDGIWMTTGAEIMGWKITELGPNGLTLAAGQQSVELKLYVDNKPN